LAPTWLFFFSFFPPTICIMAGCIPMAAGLPPAPPAPVTDDATLQLHPLSPFLLLVLVVCPSRNGSRCCRLASHYCSWCRWCASHHSRSSQLTSPSAASHSSSAWARLIGLGHYYTKAGHYLRYPV
jgi:hypothetical protein